MKKWPAFTRRLPGWISCSVLSILAFYWIPHLTYFSYRPVLLLSEDAARSLTGMSGTQRQRSFNRLVTKNIQGVVFREETIEDLESAGRAFVASGEELLRLFKLQSVASYYVFEQVRDKNLKPDGSYVFFSEAALFDRVFKELSRRLPYGGVVVYERGIFRADASFPDNFILESALPPSAIRGIFLGWPVERIRTTIGSLRPQRGDTLWPVLWSDQPAGSAQDFARDTTVPAAVHLNTPLLRFPYDSIRIVHDPLDMITFPVSSDLTNLLALPSMDPNLPLILSVLIICAASLRLSQWTPWSVLMTATILIVVFALLPTQKNWVLGAVAALIPPAALFSWMAAADVFRSGKFGSMLTASGLAAMLGFLVIHLAGPGWLVSTLLWQYPHLPLEQFCVFGVMALPLLSAALFLAVWGIEVSTRPIYPRHLRTGFEIALVLAILFWSTSAWILFVASAISWSRWMVLLERTRGRTLEDAPGNYAAFYASSALSLKLFFGCSPLSATILLIASFAGGAAIAVAWVTRAHRSA